MSSTTLTLHPVENAQAFGCPYHGEVTLIDGDLKVTLPNGEKRSSHVYGHPFYAKHPNAKGITRTAGQASEDARLGRTWLNYALISNGSTDTGLGRFLSACAFINSDEYLYCDDAATWRVKVETINNETHEYLTDRIKLVLVGTFGRIPGATCEIDLCEFELGYMLVLNSTPISDTIAVAPSPDGRSWFINTYQTLFSSTLTYWAGNAMTFIPYALAPFIYARVLREVWKIELSGNGSLSPGSIGEDIEVVATRYKTYEETFVTEVVVGDPFPGHCGECPGTPFSYPVDSCSDDCPDSSSSSDSGSGSYSSMAILGYWYDDEGNEKYGTIEASQDWSWTLETVTTRHCEEGEGVPDCYVDSITCDSMQTSTRTRTVTIPGHTESAESTYTETSDCTGVITYAGLLHGPWGTTAAMPGIPTTYFLQEAIFGSAGMNDVFTSSKTYGGSSHITVDHYGNKATSTKVGVILHPITGAGDKDTEGWI